MRQVEFLTSEPIQTVLDFFWSSCWKLLGLDASTMSQTERYVAGIRERIVIRPLPGGRFEFEARDGTVKAALVVMPAVGGTVRVRLERSP